MNSERDARKGFLIWNMFNLHVLAVSIESSTSKSVTILGVCVSADLPLGLSMVNGKLNTYVPGFPS